MPRPDADASIGAEQIYGADIVLSGLDQVNNLGFIADIHTHCDAVDLSATAAAPAASKSADDYFLCALTVRSAGTFLCRCRWRRR